MNNEPEHVAFVGSRDFPQMKQVTDIIDALPKNTVVVSGNARGVDKVAENCARKRGLKVISLPADWNRHGKSAGYIRNAEIVKLADKMYAFWDGKSRGTQHSIKLAREKNIHVIVIICDGKSSPQREIYPPGYLEETQAEEQE